MILQQHGRHRLGVGDLYDTRAVIRAVGRVDGIYTDPPWRAHDEQGFRTRAGLKPRPELTSLTPEQRWTRFCSALTAVAAAVCPDGPWFLESTTTDGGRWLAELTRACERHGARLRHTSSLSYSEHGVLALFSRTGTWLLPHNGDLGRDAPALMMQANPSLHIWADLCLGKGNTARCAEIEGRACVGVELDPRRLQAAVNTVSRVRV